MINLSEKQRKYFYDKLIKDNDCLIWNGKNIKKNGYGMVQFNGKNYSVHRLALILNSNNIEEKDKLACHRPLICHNRLCCNPEHLYWGTSKDNYNDSLLDKTATFIAKYGIDNNNAKFNVEQIKDIRNLIGKESVIMVSKKYGCHRTTINRIMKNKTYTNID
jgi:hypothetical protein